MYNFSLCNKKDIIKKLCCRFLKDIFNLIFYIFYELGI